MKERKSTLYALESEQLLKKRILYMKIFSYNLDNLFKDSLVFSPDTHEQLSSYSKKQKILFIVSFVYSKKHYTIQPSILKLTDSFLQTTFFTIEPIKNKLKYE